MASNYFPETSAYSMTPSTGQFIGRYVHRQILPEAADRPIILDSKYTHRPDLLAHDVYGNWLYFWVFASRNPNVIRDVIWDFVGGIEIVIPTIEAIRKAKAST